MTEQTAQDTSYPVLEAFRRRLDFPLDQFQVTACERLEDGRSVLVAAPTGSGKTTVAEFAVFLARREHNARIFYTAPIKALSNQKFRELCSEYGDDEVGLLTGDVNIRGDAPIVVMTTEVLRNMIYAESAALTDLAFVVLDEVHYLGDRWRGAVWEEIILHLPTTVRLVSLSATVSNAEEFGDWMHAVRGDTDVVLSEHRPVPLYQHVLTRKALFPLYASDDGELALRGRVNPELRKLAQQSKSHEGSGRQRESRAHNGDRYRSHRNRSRGAAPVRRQSRIRRSDMARALDEMGLLPGIVFIFSRNGCDQAVAQCLHDGVRLTSREERDEIRRVIHQAVDGLSDDERAVLGVSTWISGLERGIAAHHAGLLPQFKSAVETLFQRKLVKLVFATETLALGINMPARSVTIENLEKFNGEQRLPLTSGEYTQLTGRAGRRGIDHEGHAVVVWDQNLDIETLAHLASARSFPVRSRFVPTPNMAVNLLQRMTPADARDILELSFAQFQADRAVVDQARELRNEQESLAGYERAARRASGSEKKRWEDRARKLRKQIERGRRRVEARSGSIARTFDRVVAALTELDYLDNEKVTEWGLVLARIYGERDLLVAECLRHDVWRGIDAPGFAALCCALTYEPRRDGEAEGRWPGGTFRPAFEHTLDLWEHLTALDERQYLAGADAPHAGLASAMQGWAQGWSLTRTLEEADIGAGDFVRWAKQTIDLLDQIAQAAEHAEIDVDRLGAIAQLAREAKRRIRRGIVETSSSA
ncbi:MAG: DEAD/DEAH box helicase [Microbacteriaceae bacterium]|nr:DEAD/DEAH box helicase [Microbacteriaceae bacterium]